MYIRVESWLEISIRNVTAFQVWIATACAAWDTVHRDLIFKFEELGPASLFGGDG